MRRQLMRTAPLALVMLLGAAIASAGDLKFPELTGRVVDNAGVLNPRTISQLDAMLSQHENTSSEQVVVVTLDSLQGHTIEDYGYQLGRYWGIGQNGKNNGILLIIAPHERKVRIEVGYGLEGQLTDATSRMIIENYVTPQFRDGDFNAGALAGTAGILRALGDDAAARSSANENYEAQPPHGVEQLPPAIELALLFFFLMVIVVVWRRRRMPYVVRHGLYNRPFYGVGFPRGGSGGPSSGGGGFSGGGGSFGGGGASGSW